MVDRQADKKKKKKGKDEGKGRGRSPSRWHATCNRDETDTRKVQENAQGGLNIFFIQRLR